MWIFRFETAQSVREGLRLMVIANKTTWSVVALHGNNIILWKKDRKQDLSVVECQLVLGAGGIANLGFIVIEILFARAWRIFVQCVLVKID